MAEQTGFADSNWTLGGKVTITNPNDWEDIALTGLTDVVDNGGVCTVDQGPYTVPADKSLDVNYTCSYASEPSSYSGTNKATATWGSAAAFTPTGSASGSAPFTLTQAGSTNKTVQVTDSYKGNLGTATATDAAPFAKGTFTYDRTESGVAGTCTNYDNTAKVTETNQTAGQTVTLCVGKDLTVSKTAAPTFTRTFDWSISKSVDKTLVKQVGGSATFNYTVMATETGFTDSAWKVAGTITLSNPNDWEAITANVADAVDNGGTCKVYDGTAEVTSVDVAKSGSKSLTYTCTWASKPANYSGTNTATATWDKDVYSTPTGSASGTASFAFDDGTVGNPTNVNKMITLTDTFNGTTATLGAVTGVTTTPYATKAFTYSHTVSVPAFGCKAYTNTAKIVETGQSASQTVTVCGPIKTGVLSKGYWQNKNGQAIITGQAKTGVCPSATWLRQYAPFQDLSATATCKQVASYVSSVMGSADASGPAMNAMLKAQMLATALDVYFSDPALGGNKIGAPAPIGGVAVDLTMICTDLSCTAFENSSAQFGGTPKTVQQMLTYAAGQSNVGGSAWYGQVKSTQELAKDAFDAIDNEKVFAP